MVGCLVLAFALCNPNTPYGGYAYQGGSYAYAQSGAYVVQQPPVYVVQPPVYYAQPVYVAQPQYYGGYGYNRPFGGISVAVGPRGGVRVGVGN